MKKLSVLVLLLSVIVAAGCSKDDTEEASKNPTLTIEKTDYTIAAEGGFLEALFEVNVDWMASVKYVGSDANWLTLNSEYGKAGKVTLTMIAEPNRVTAERKASVRILYGGQMPCVLSVVQSGLEEADKTPTLTIEKTDYTIADTGGSVEALFEVNVDWTASVEYVDSEAKWLTLNPESGKAGKVTLTMIAEPNPVTAEREASVRILYGGETPCVLSVVQSGLNKDITADFDPFFAQELQKRSYITDAKKVMLKEVNEITNLEVAGRCLPGENRYEGKLTSLRGIEYFESLTYLDCSGNQLTALDVSKNTALTTLYCFANQLTALDVSKNTALTDLWCDENQLTTLDVSKNTALKALSCYANQLTMLDVSKNTVLTELDCSYNDLTTLDVSNNTALKILSCHYNQLTTLDVSKNTALTQLTCIENRLTALDVSKNAALTELWCSYNQLTTLDVSKNTALIWLGCFVNQLTTLDVSRNTALTELGCGANRLTTLDVSKNTALTSLECGGNQLTTLDVSRNTALTRLACEVNQLTALDVCKNTALTYLDCSYNQLTTLDVSKNTAQTNLYCYKNQLTTLDVSKNTALTYLNCQDNQLATLDVSKNTALTHLDCDYNPGNGAVFPVTAWFDNNSIPNSKNFTTGSWDYNGKTVRIDYRKAK